MASDLFCYSFDMHMTLINDKANIVGTKTVSSSKCTGHCLYCVCINMWSLICVFVWGEELSAHVFCSCLWWSLYCHSLQKCSKIISSKGPLNMYILLVSNQGTLHSQCSLCCIRSISHWKTVTYAPVVWEDDVKVPYSITSQSELNE